MSESTLDSTARMPPDDPAHTPHRLHCRKCHVSVNFDGEAPSESLPCPGCGHPLTRATDPTTALVAGARLGRFLLYECVGSGAFGTIWKARDPNLDRFVALKIPHSGTSLTGLERLRFHREAQAAANLRHPGIVPVHELVTIGDQLILVAEFVQGDSLKKILTRGRIPRSVAIDLVLQAARALHYIHEMNYVHRDIKPANLLVEMGGNSHDPWKLRIIDLGMVRENEDATITCAGQVLGTPAYMSPEQASGQGHKADARSDVYSLGVVLYELLTGRAPFQGSKSEILQLVRNREPRRPRSIDRSLPADLEAICLRCLRKSPAERFPSCAALAEELTRTVRGQATETPPVPVWHGLPEALHSRIGATASVALGFILLLGLALGLSHPQRQEKPNVPFPQNFRERKTGVLAALEKGQRACDSGDLGEGLLWFTQGLQGVSSGMEDLDSILRANLGGWGRRASALKMLYESDVRILTTAITRDGSHVYAGCTDGTVLVLNTRTGERDHSLRHPGQVQTMALSSDGTILATGSSKGTVCLWNVPDGEVEISHIRHEDAIHRILFQPRGSRLATVTHSGVLRLWSMTGQMIGVPVALDGESPLVQFTPDGATLVALRTDGVLALIHADTGLQPRVVPPLVGPVHAAALHPNGKRLAYCGLDGQIHVRALEADEHLGLPIQGPAGLSALEYSPQGKFLACLGQQRHLWLVSPDNASSLPREIPSEAQVNRWAFCPMGLRLATTHSSGVKLWDPTSGQMLESIREKDPSHRVQFSGDSSHFVTTGAKGTLAIRRLPLGACPVWRMQHDGMVHRLASSPNGRFLATASHDHTSRLWNADTGEPIGPPMCHQDVVTAVVFRPDSKVLLTASLDGKLKTWDTSTGQQLGGEMDHEGEIFQVAVSPSGDYAATVGLGKRVVIWNLVKGKCVQKFAHDNAIYDVAFRLDSQALATASQEGTVRVWNLKDETCVILPHGKPVRVLAWSPDGIFLATGCNDHKAYLWHAQRGDKVGLPMEHSGSVVVLAFDTSGQRLLTGSEGGTARLWDAGTGSPLGPPLTHSGWVSSVAFAPMSRTVLTGSHTGSAHLWDPIAGKRLGPPLRLPLAIVSAHLDARGRRLRAAGADGSVNAWNLPLPLGLSQERTALLMPTIVGATLAQDGSLNPLDALSWKVKRRRLSAEEQNVFFTLPRFP